MRNRWIDNPLKIRNTKRSRICVEWEKKTYFFRAVHRFASRYADLTLGQLMRAFISKTFNVIVSDCRCLFLVWTAILSSVRSHKFMILRPIYRASPLLTREVCGRKTEMEQYTIQRQNHFLFFQFYFRYFFPPFFVVVVCFVLFLACTIGQIVKAKCND